jgi:hypothetical protein
VFEGRCPSIAEVTTVSDSHWLKCPGVGPATLETIHKVIFSQAKFTDTPSVHQLTDAELLQRLGVLQDHLHLIRSALEARIAPSRKSRLSRLELESPEGIDPCGVW